MHGTWDTLSLQRAIKEGYTITKIYSGFAYKQYTGLMKGYVEHFVKMKICNSGIKTLDQCEKLNKEHQELGLNIHIKSEETYDNPGMKQIAKICLNSLWGKFGQRSNLPQYEFYHEHNYAGFLRKILNDKITTKTWDIINETCVELQYEEDGECIIDADYISEITSVFTTANARLRLYDMLAWLHPSQLIYCDTDSVIFLYDENNPLHKKPVNATDLPKSVRFGKALSNWENELDDGEWIDEIVCGGAKSYAYKTNKGKMVIKQKGITMDVANSKILTFETLKELTLNDRSIDTAKRYQFSWDGKTKDVVTKFISRSVRSTLKEKRSIDGYDTKPFGYRIN
jgi:hypothetical protein